VVAVTRTLVGEEDGTDAASKRKFQDYTEAWVAQRAGLRPRMADLYRWLLGKHITPYFGNVPTGKITTQAVRQWRPELISWACP
jgi:hypothetical protein